MINSRQKGVGFERKVARILREVYPEAKRGLQYQQGEYVPDIVGTPYYIECKSGKTHLSVNYGNKKVKKYSPNKNIDLEKILNYYTDRKKLWKKGLKLLLIWKLDYKKIKVTRWKNNKIYTENLNDFLKNKKI